MGKILLAHKEDMIAPVLLKVLFCYKCWQPSYTEMLRIMPDITSHQEMPNDVVQSNYFDPSVPSLIVLVL